MERTTIAEAAKKLDVTQEAIRQRIRRGTIEHEKGEDGKTYVYLTDEETSSQPLTNGVVNDYINALKYQIESLEQDKEEWKEEARRKDHIIMALTQRIPELEAAETKPEAPVTNSTETGKGDVPSEAQKPSWWRRIFAS